jgi:hypothetical protein
MLQMAQQLLGSLHNSQGDYFQGNNTIRCCSYGQKKDLVWNTTCTGWKILVQNRNESEINGNTKYLNKFCSVAAKHEREQEIRSQYTET